MQHIYWTGSVADPATIKISAGRCGSRAVASLYAIRTWALDRLARLYPDDPHTAALLEATLLGETGGVERRWTNDFRVTGTLNSPVATLTAHLNPVQYMGYRSQALDVHALYANRLIHALTL